MTMRSLQRRTLSLLAIAGLTLGVASVAQPAVAAPAAARSNYIVTLTSPGVGTYTGGVPGLVATAPAAQGEKIARGSEAVEAYRAHLQRIRDAVLSAAPSAELLYNYDYTIAGFAATLTAAEAAVVARSSAVASVVPDELRQLDTSRTPTFLGLTGAGGGWSKLGGPNRAGDTVIVGIVDSGFVPENASFGPMVTTAASDAAVAAKFSGICDPGDEAPLVTCNKKVIGARDFRAGFGSVNAADFLSARDYNGHGSHTASTSAGNDGVNAVVDGQSLATISGMAPQARISVYKVCWEGQSALLAGCSSSDSVAAIDTAVADGVDVINYSISGSLTSFTDPVETAFYRAAAAGVFVAASAGNSGPGASTVAHNSPWLTTVAASTHDRVYDATATLGNGTSYDGAGLGTAVASSPLVYAGDVKLASASLTNAQLCYADTLDPAKVVGKIVLCDRGTIARVEKSQSVQDAGGVGMILANTAPSSLNADLHFVPTVHVDEVDRTAIMNYIDTAPNPTAALTAGVETIGARAPLMAAFSSRGPAKAGGGDLIKPDITAPGVDVLAAYAPTSGGFGHNFDYLSGTSMSSPHIAGLAALLIQARPTWTPMMVKSALMTTASVLDNTGAPITNDDGTAANPFNYGSGHVALTSALTPNLVFNSVAADWQKFVCGTGTKIPGAPACSVTGSIDPSNLNLASIGIGQLRGSQAVTRTFTNVSGKTARFTVQVAAPAGTTVTVNPAVVQIANNASATVTITISRTTAPNNVYTIGSLTWTTTTAGGIVSLIVTRIPIAVKPAA
ncbi:MAG: S8 family serine peptidase [Geodermatophilaceae bacterium]|nr:S8 family serine peptidase [Geodermatophilaceae bacterium]